ncbi:winged helix-turn-helix domain-containing protein [uncultured Methanobrevibacter sp.]|uniref:winged helix-turn-helix domain-containing protein n=1 Tax=uncultured Methanobrevibacter sp. TaxID=253161 RepID=UPI0025CC8FC3|nr:winged helix-turn-helix domain-containing protein [uncultured Methanobrevibacter sp.]
MSEIKNALVFLLLQRKGGKTTAKVIEQLLIRPYNSNQMADALNVSYNTAAYHLRLMQKNKLIERKNSDYGTYYVATESLLKEKDSFEEIKKLL